MREHNRKPECLRKVFRYMAQDGALFEDKALAARHTANCWLREELAEFCSHYVPSRADIRDVADALWEYESDLASIFEERRALEKHLTEHPHLFGEELEEMGEGPQHVRLQK